MLPTVAGGDGSAKDVEVLDGIDTLVRGRGRLRVPRHQRATVDGAAAKLQDAAESLTSVGEGFALSVVDVEQPLLTARTRQSDRATLAVVEHVRRLVHDKVIKLARRVELVQGDEAGRVGAEPDDERRIL